MKVPIRANPALGGDSRRVHREGAKNAKGGMVREAGGGTGGLTAKARRTQRAEGPEKAETGGFTAKTRRTRRSFFFKEHLSR